MIANTEMSNIRELTADETDNVAGGNPVAAFIIGYIATKMLDGALGGGKSVMDMVKEAVEKGNQKH